MVIEAEDLQFVRRGGGFSLTLPSFSMAAGEAMAVLGSSGSGKSTLLNLTLRFFDIETGRITIDAQDIRDVSLVEMEELYQEGKRGEASSQ